MGECCRCRLMCHFEAWGGVEGRGRRGNLIPPCVIARRGAVWRGEDAVAISWTKGQDFSDGWVPPQPPGEIATGHYMALAMTF